MLCLVQFPDKYHCAIVSNRGDVTSRIRFIVGAHFSTSSFVCSYAASRSIRSCARCGSGAGNASFFEFDEASNLADFLSDVRDGAEPPFPRRGAKRSSTRSLPREKQGVQVSNERKNAKGFTFLRCSETRAKFAFRSNLCAV